MTDSGAKLRRGILIGVVAWSLFTALIFAVFGGGILMSRAYDAADTPAVFGIVYLAYAIFLMAFASGLLQEKPWAWYAGFVAAGISILLGVQRIVAHAWGTAAFDLLYGSVLAGTLLWARKAGQAPEATDSR